MPYPRRQAQILRHQQSTNQALSNYLQSGYYNRELSGGDLVTDSSKIILGEGALATAVVLSDGNEKIVASTFILPEFWLDGKITLTTFYAANAAPVGSNEDVRITRTVTTHGDGDDVISEGTQILSVASTLTLTDNDHTTLVDISTTRLTALASILTVSLIRSPGNAADNYTSDFYVFGFNVEYHPQFLQ